MSEEKEMTQEEQEQARAEHAARVQEMKRVEAAQETLRRKFMFLDQVVLAGISNPQVLDKNNQPAQVAHSLYDVAEAVWNERNRRLAGMTAQPVVAAPAQPYTGIPQAVPGQMFPQMPMTPSGIPAVAPVPGYNAMHQVDTKSVIAHAGQQGHPYGPTVIATDMKGANISAAHPGGSVPVGPPIQGEPRVLATDMQGALASSKNPLPGM